MPMNFYFNDFSSDLREIRVYRKGILIESTRGLTNTEGRKPVYHVFPNSDIMAGDTFLVSGRMYEAIDVVRDSFNGAEFLVVSYVQG